MPAQISLHLDKPNYRPGDAVCGTMHLTARSDLRPRSVLLHAFGEEVTTLGPNTLMTQHSHPFDLSFDLWSPTAHADRLRQGEYDFPFEFALPGTLPPTFNGEFTRIVYVIEAKVDLPLQADIRHEQTLHVLPAPLLDTAQPVSGSASSPQGVTAELALNASGFYPGDHVTGTLRVTGAGAAADHSRDCRVNFARERRSARVYRSLRQSARAGRDRSGATDWRAALPDRFADPGGC